MNTTLSADDQVAERARGAAGAMGKSLDQSGYDFLLQLGGREQLGLELRVFEKSALESPGRLRGWKFDREEACRRT